MKPGIGMSFHMPWLITPFAEYDEMN